MKFEYRIKQVYGSDMVYPANDTAVKFSQLIGKKTFSQSDLNKIQELGYNLERVF